MKAVILAGGFGTRISEESHLKPKPMIEVGGKPILWHILKIYSKFGINEFIICLGYKGEIIKDYFRNYHFYNRDLSVNLAKGTVELHGDSPEPWNVTLVDTGLNTGTAGRLKRVAKFFERGEAFCFTYGDGVADVDVLAEINFHFSHNRLATVCAVKPPGRYGLVKMQGDSVLRFTEKPSEGEEWINGGFFVLNSSVFDQIESDSDSFEIDVLPKLAQNGELAAWKHYGYWQPMDTLRDRNVLEKAWNSEKPPWKSW